MTMLRVKAKAKAPAVPSLNSVKRNLSGQPASFLPVHVGDFRLKPLESGSPPLIQRKLVIGEPGDKYEREADSIAETVMRMTAPVIQRKGTCPFKNGPSCGDTEEKLQMKESSGRATVAATDVPSIVHEALRSPGQPLDAGTRAYMEPRFEHDFSQVRVHADTKAAESAKSVNALAYTVGRDMVFGRGQYAPGTSEGRKLLGHELTHTIQQQAATQVQGSIQRRVVVQNPDQRPPRAPATETNASIINNYAGTLCSGFSVDASGVLNPPSNTFCASATTTSTPESCRCLCDMTSLKDAAGNDVEWKVFVADDQWPHTHFPTRSVYVHSPYSGMQFGAWSAGPNSGP